MTNKDNAINNESANLLLTIFKKNQVIRNEFSKEFENNIKTVCENINSMSQLLNQISLNNFKNDVQVYKLILCKTIQKMEIIELNPKLTLITMKEIFNNISLLESNIN
jgi:hypothetical protein